MPKNNENNETFWFPIRVGMKTQVELNGRVFIMRVVEVNMRPGYCCQCDSLSSNVEESALVQYLLYISLFLVPKLNFLEC